jgi:hypothetical protein
MAYSWPSDVIRELIAQAEASGESRATLSSVEEARLFRFAIYSFRRTNFVGQELTIAVDGVSVVLARRVLPVISIDTAAAAEEEL